MNGETTSLKRLSSLLLHSIKGLSSAYNQSAEVTDDDELLKLGSVSGCLKKKKYINQRWLRTKATKHMRRGESTRKKKGNIPYFIEADSQ